MFRNQEEICLVGNANRPQVSVCVCTFRRPILLNNLLDALDKLDLKLVSVELVVVDNSPDLSAMKIIENWQFKNNWKSVRYFSETRPGISFARNRAIKESVGEWVAFIDDDEEPCKEWLLALIDTANRTSADAVIGAVRPRFPAGSAPWATVGGAFDRPEFFEGESLSFDEGRTGNLLIRRAWVDADEPFNIKLGLTGGEDSDFFRRMGRLGGVLRWSRAAVVYEWVPYERQRLTWLLGRSHASATLYWRFVRIESGFLPAIFRAIVGVFGTVAFLIVGAACWPLSKKSAVNFVLTAAKCWARVSALSNLQAKRYGQ